MKKTQQPEYFQIMGLVSFHENNLAFGHQSTKAQRTQYVMIE